MTTGRAWRADRRDALRVGLGALAAGSAAAFGGCACRPFWAAPPVVVDAPGQAVGHRLRERWRAGAPTYSEWRAAPAETVDVAIVGAGVAGLSCAWQLARSGHRDHLVLTGPEWLGNAAGREHAGMGCPSGSHYLPLPSRESRHLRELLAHAGVLLDGLDAEAPTFDERVLVHAPSHRVLAAGRWEAGPIPGHDGDAAASDDAARFLARMDAFSAERGADGRRAFVVPIELASADAPSRTLDRLTAAAWLEAEGLRDPALIGYLEYCARDEFGGTLQSVSAWAIAHYFASRRGRASNAEPGAVLTWPDGLAPLARHLAAPAVAAQRVRPVSVERIERQGAGVRLYGWRHAADGEVTPVVVNARLAVVAAPLPIAARMVPELAGPWATSSAAATDRAPWTVANIVFRRPPTERGTGGEDLLAWDNVVHGSPALGFVNAAHQMIRLDTTGPLVLTAYRAYPAADRDARAALRRLIALDAPAPARAWLELVGPDLVAAYGHAVWRDVVRVHVSVRGHGMSAPAPGFLDDALLHALRRETGPVRFAHADLSGYSVFEEAAWWGHRAARAIGG